MKKIKPINFEDIRSYSDGAWDGIVKSIIESSAGYTPNIQPAQKYSLDGEGTTDVSGASGTEKPLQALVQ